MTLHWLSRVAASAAVRRLVYIAVAALIGLAATCVKAHAATKEEAYQSCSAIAIIDCGSREDCPAHYKSECEDFPETPTTGQYRLHYTYDGNSQGYGPSWPYAPPDCPPGTQWDPTTHVCATNDCANAAPKGPGYQTGASTVCDGGCEFKGSPTGDDIVNNICFGSAFCGATKWKPTGNVCMTENPLKEPFDKDKQTCVSTGGGFSECVKPNGDHCVSSPKALTEAGRTMCWSTGETGPRMTQDGKDGANRQKVPNTPTPPPAMKDPEPKTTTTTTINGDTYNTTTFTGTGNNGGQSNVGNGGSDDSPGAPDDGEEDDKGSASGGATCGAAPACSGDSVMCNVLDQQWRTRCAGDANGDGRADWTNVTGDGSEGAGDEPEKPHHNLGLSLSMLDESGFSLGRTCPTFGSVELPWGGSFDFDSITWVCDLCEWIFVCMTLMGGFLAIIILAGR